MNRTERMRLTIRNMNRMGRQLDRVSAVRLIGFFVCMTGLILLLLFPVSLGLLALAMMAVGAADWLICVIRYRIINSRLEREEDLYVQMSAEEYEDEPLRKNGR